MLSSCRDDGNRGLQSHLSVVRHANAPQDLGPFVALRPMEFTEKEEEDWRSTSRGLTRSRRDVAAGTAGAVARGVFYHTTTTACTVTSSCVQMIQKQIGMNMQMRMTKSRRVVVFLVNLPRPTHDFARYFGQALQKRDRLKVMTSPGCFSIGKKPVLSMLHVKKVWLNRVPDPA